MHMRCCSAASSVGTKRSHSRWTSFKAGQEYPRWTLCESPFSCFQPSVKQAFLQSLSIEDAVLPQKMLMECGNVLHHSFHSLLGIADLVLIDSLVLGPRLKWRYWMIFFLIFPGASLGVTLSPFASGFSPRISIPSSASISSF